MGSLAFGFSAGATDAGGVSSRFRLLAGVAPGSGKGGTPASWAA